MSKQKTRAATAAIDNTLTEREIKRLCRLQAEFDRTKPLYDELALSSPKAVMAIEEYANSYLCDVLFGKCKRNAKIHRHAANIANSLACVTIDKSDPDHWKPYAREALEMHRTKSEELGDGIPFDVALGMRYIRHNLPELHSHLVKMDAAIGPVIEMDGSDFSYSALLMRTALAAA